MARKKAESVKVVKMDAEEIVPVFEKKGRVRKKTITKSIPLRKLTNFWLKFLLAEKPSVATRKKAFFYVIANYSAEQFDKLAMLKKILGERKKIKITSREIFSAWEEFQKRFFINSRLDIMAELEWLEELLDPDDDFLLAIKKAICEHLLIHCQPAELGVLSLTLGRSLVIEVVERFLLVCEENMSSNYYLARLVLMEKFFPEQQDSPYVLKCKKQLVFSYLREKRYYQPPDFWDFLETSGFDEKIIQEYIFWAINMEHIDSAKDVTQHFFGDNKEYLKIVDRFSELLEPYKKPHIF